MGRDRTEDRWLPDGASHLGLMGEDDTSARLAHAWADALIDQLVAGGVSHFFIAPGSRSTPLTMAAARHPGARTTVHYDERGTAFMALGAARSTDLPAAWITTSGTAVANGFPAVVEAHVDHVPLILLTSDRPPELRQTGANQTIDQVKIFGDNVRWFFDLPVPSADLPLEFVRSTAAQAVLRSTGADAGPVHLNCMFREPLVPAEGRWDASYDASALFAAQHGVAAAAPATVEQIRSFIGDAQRGMIVVGRLRSAADAQHVGTLARALQWPMVADVQSQLRLGTGAEAPLLAHIDPLLASTRSIPPLPDLILHFGSGLVSRRIARWLASAPSARRISIRTESSRIDPFHQVDLRVICDLPSMAQALANDLPAPAESRYLKSWREVELVARRRLRASFDEQDHATEPAVAHHLTGLIPSSHILMLGSSMPIRDVDMFAAVEGDRPFVISNRGASGIDGTLASAIGAAIAAERPATVFCGDLTLLHDLNSLAAAARSHHPIIIVVINNDGGGIFSFLPVARHERVFEPYFGTPHGLTFEHASAMFGLAYTQTNDMLSFRGTYREALARRESSIIEITTDRQENAAEHQRLFDLIRDA